MAETATKNKRSSNFTKPPENKYHNKRDVKIYKHCEFEIVEIEKEKIDNIKSAIENAESTIGKNWFFGDVALGLSTTFLGSFIGCIPNIIEMVSLNQITAIVFFYFFLLLIAIVLFFIYLNVKRKKHIAIVSLVETIKKETDSISKSWTVPDNEFPNVSSSNELTRTLDNK